jgi:regulation of enolase protein 1 (concanavalin A-like superfamily)
MTRIPALLTIVLAAFFTLSAAAEDKKPQTIKGWGTAVDPDGDCKFEEKEGTVTIRVPGTNHDLTYQDAAGKLNAPRLLREVEGDFTIQVKVLKFPMRDADAKMTGMFPFTSAGLLIWKDDKNFFRIERAAVGSPPFAYLGGIIDGKNTVHQGGEISDTDTVLRAERKGNKLTFSARDADATNWSDLHTETIELPAKLMVGVESVNTVDKEFPAKFQELELKQ